MQTSNHIISSTTKGLIIAAVLVFFHILASRNDSLHTKAEIFKVASHEAQPYQDENEPKFVMASYSINGTMHLETVREMMILLKVVFNSSAVIKKYTILIPIPLGRHFRVLFSCVISSHAP